MKIREKVSGHVRMGRKGKPVRVTGYRRIKQRTGRLVPLGKPYKVVYYQDSGTGEIVSKRKYMKTR